MHQLLVYSDSLTWGVIPNTRNRLSFDHHWPGVLENGLNASGERVGVIEDCLNGRRTVWDDPFKPGRNGLAGPPTLYVEQFSASKYIRPLSLVGLTIGTNMLGTNDLQFCHPYKQC